MSKMVGKNAVSLNFPSHTRIHPVVHVSFTEPYVTQPDGIQQPMRKTAMAVEVTREGPLHVVEPILSHR